MSIATRLRMFAALDMLFAVLAIAGALAGDWWWGFPIGWAASALFTEGLAEWRDAGRLVDQ